MLSVTLEMGMFAREAMNLIFLQSKARYSRCPIMVQCHRESIVKKQVFLEDP